MNAWHRPASYWEVTYGSHQGHSSRLLLWRRGCHKKAKDAARNPDIPRPIYILGLIVHNRHVVDELREGYGIISLDGADRLTLLRQIDRGTVIFTAHGVSPRIKQEAEARGLTCIDATCPDVTRTHDLVRKLVERGYHIIYVGKRGHPESEGIIGEAPDHVHLIQNAADVDALQLPPAPLAVTTQTTLSQWDTKDLIDHIRQRYPDIEVYNEICLATQERQVAAVEAAADADVVIVVGDSRSNNSNRLVQVVKERAGKPAYLVDSARDLRPEWFIGCRKVAVTAGSSTPTVLTREVIEALEDWPTTPPAVHPVTLARSHYENFTVMSRLLPRRLRQDVANLYAYCRTVDDREMRLLAIAWRSCQSAKLTCAVAFPELLNNLLWWLCRRQFVAMTSLRSLSWT